MGPKKLPKYLKLLSWAPQGLLGTPAAAKRPPGSHFEAARRPPGSHFGAVWGPFSNHFGDMLGHFRPKLPASPAAPAILASQVLRVGGCPR